MLRKEPFNSPNLPAPKGPYSQAVKVGDLIFVSGTGPIDPQTGEVVRGSIEDQVRLTLDNVKALLEEAGSSLDQVVKTTVFLQDMDDFPKMNQVYATYFSTDPPARTTVQAARLPLDMGVEIEVIACLG